MTPKKWVIVKFVSKKFKLHNQMRAVPEPWLTPKTDAATDDGEKPSEKRYSCRLPPFTIEFELSSKVCKHAKVKASWKAEDVDIIVDADTYEAALKAQTAAENVQNRAAIGNKPKPRIREEVVVAPRRSQTRNSSEVSEVDMDQLSDRDMMKVILDNVQEVEAKQNKILVAIENQPFNQNTGDTAEDRKIDEIYDDLPCESSNALKKVDRKIASDEKYKDALKAYLKSLSNKGGHDLMQRMISAVMTNFVQNQFNMEGKRGKAAFDKLLLWPVLKDAAVSKYRSTYATTDATKSAGDWIKNAKKRMGRGNAKTKRKTLDDLVTAEGENGR